MEFRIIRWEGKHFPTEGELRETYSQEGLSPYAWSNGPYDTYAAHSHAYHKVIYIVRGSITWILPHLGQEIDMHPGDRLELPCSTLHAARVGPQGVTCLEAHWD